MTDGSTDLGLSYLLAAWGLTDCAGFRWLVALVNPDQERMLLRGIDDTVGNRVVDVLFLRLRRS